MRVPGYEAIQELLRDDWHTLYRGRRVEGQQPVLLKTLRRQAGVSDRESLEAEFELLRELSGIPGLIRACGLPDHAERPCLALEDGGGIPLHAMIASGRRDLRSFFRIASQLCTTLAELHRRDITHNNINPRGILVEPTTGAIWVLDLGAASRSSGETRAPAARLRGNAAYMSPEQTGRMNRAVDYRTDFYSLGVTLYELLTGVLPFSSYDPLELIHWHIARTPAPPAALDPDVPEPVSEVVMKLLAKTAEERYQSALGLREDLERCEREWTERGQIAPFALGRRDVSDRFVIPQKLYGRDQEVAELLGAFDRTCEGETSMMLVAGYSGIGKTSLIQELYRPIVRQRGYFISGKFDQVVRNIPYGALIQAFRGLVQQLLTESEDRLALWRARLSEALGSNAGVLTEVIPELELILGKQPPPAPLGPTEAQNRFRYVFQNLVGALARKEHPLAVFLDDLQWADPATLSLLQPMLNSPDVRHLFLIGAYRDNEVEAAHPLARTLAALESSGAPIHRLLLGPLRPPELVRLVADAFHSDLSEVEPLAQIVLQKTDGNPFFVIQFLKTLKQEGLLEFDYNRARWTFRLETIAAAGMTDNVIDLMIRKIQRLAAGTQRALTLAACIGNPFDPGTLAIVSEQPPEGAATDLKEALNEGLILPAGAEYAFLHDRVQQAAYAMIPEERKQSVHLRVGRLLLSRWDPATAEQKLFDVAHHLNLGSSLITEEAERLALARLNLSAGRKAESSAAYQAALAYFRAGLALLTPARWDSDYELAFALHYEAAQCDYLCGYFDEAERCFRLLLGKARTRLDSAQVHALRILQYENMSRYADAVSAGREGLALFGLSLPEAAAEKAAALETELQVIQELLGGRRIRLLVDLPVVQEPEIRSVMKLLTAMWAPAYVAGDQPLTRVISAVMVRLSLAHGNIEESGYGYVTHAITVGSVKGDFKSGYEWGELALRVNERFNDARHRAKIRYMFSCFVNVWRRPMQTCIPYAREACRSGLETGDFAYANYGAFHESWYGLLTSRSLDQFARDYEPNIALLKKIKMESFAETQKIILNWARALQGRTNERTSLSDENFDEALYRETYGDQPFFTTFYWVVKLHLFVTFGAYERALDAARRAAAVVHTLSGTIWPVLLNFLHGLALAALDRRAGEEERGPYAAQVQALCGPLELAAENCPENFRCYWLLLRAEFERISDRPLEAMALYEEAIRYARTSASLPNEAMSNELYARFWLDRGHELIAPVYFEEALRAYADWGAAAKARELEEKCARRPPAAVAQPDRPEAAALDVTTVAKAAHAIAVEIVLEDLLRKLIEIALENAGAQRGVFLLERNGELAMEAEGDVDRGVRVLESVPLERSSNVAQSLVRFARKTGQSVVIGDASRDERFADDPYIAAARPRSILCVPVVHQGKFAGILYLENNLAVEAFTAERIRVMHMLASQAAISLENARIYAEMKREVERRRQAEEQLRAALAEVERLRKKLEAENVYLQEEIRREHNFEEIVGNSPALLSVLENVEKVAPTDSTVLISGETGTGKELIARAIHNRSGRKNRPLVKVNCGAISAGLVESELFGHVKGAFTGALERRVGRFEVADGGTLFLDEVSELPPETQVKLLRVLQEGEFEPVGSNRTVRVDVRIIAATNRNLEEAVREGRFRLDLFYRLNVFPIQVPPLRERRSDVAQLVTFFVSRFSKKLGKRIEAVSQETMERLLDYSWPGNIRELQNIIERGVVLTPEPVLTLDDGLLPAAARMTATARPPQTASPQRSAAPPAPHQSLEEVERRHILAVLEQAGWVIEGGKGAAQILNLHPNTLRSRMKKLGIRRSDPRIVVGGA